jgi:hypothetical protein
MVALGVAGCVAAAERRPAWAGLWLGLAIAAKQTGMVWLIPAGFLWLAATARKPPAGLTGRPSGWIKPAGGLWGAGLARAAAGFLPVLGLVALWDRVRVAHGASGFWQAGVTGYGGLRLIWPSEWASRLVGWVGLARELLGLPVLNLLLVGGVGLLALWGVRNGPRWAALYDLALTGFCLGYLLIHWLWAFPVWDRYLLPLVPFVAVLLGRVVAAPGRWAAAKAALRGPAAGRLAGVLVAVAFLVCLTIPAVRAAAGDVAVGAGWAGYDGIEQVVAFLSGLPKGAVLYHHWLGWAYAFYLYDAPLYQAYWPTPAWLARDVQVFGRAEPRYIVFPAWESSARVEAALAQVGYQLDPLYQSHSPSGELRFTAYQIIPITSHQ